MQLVAKNTSDRIFVAKACSATELDVTPPRKPLQENRFFLSLEMMAYLVSRAPSSFLPIIYTITISTH